MMTNTQHFMNAIERAQNENMTIVKNGAPDSNDYIVINDDKAYNISIQEGQITKCTCPHHTYRGVICKHMAKVSLTNNINIGLLNTNQEGERQVG